MLIRFQSEFLSIKDFKEVRLPNFTVLTGLNGVGKSHLFNAILNGAVIIDNLDQKDISLFNNTSFTLNDEQPVLLSTLQGERQNVYSTIQNVFVTNHNLASQIRSEISIILSFLENTKRRFYDLTETDFISAGIKEIFPAYNNYRNNIKNISSNDYNYNNNPNKTKPAIIRILREAHKPIEYLTKEDIDNIYVPISYTGNFLLNELGKIFSDYWEKWELNLYKKFRNSQYRNSFETLSDEEFEKTHGKKPWDIINNILLQFGSLQYKVNNPEGLERENPFQLQLLSVTNTNVSINFSSLSSGEKTMLALVSSLYKSNIDSHFPKLLLLDEIDASLHPSMTQSMLNVLKQELAIGKGLNIILVTHSPSTVALALEDSIYVMNKEGVNRIVKSSNEEALNILTEGFASLTKAESDLKISYNLGRSSDPVLCTEGITDKIILEKAWSMIETNKMSFDIQDCFDASFLRNMFQREEIFTNYSSKIFIALFDFDKEGYDAWNGLSKFSVIEDDPEKGLLKKHNSYNAYALLLPVSNDAIKEQVIKQGKETYKDKSYMPIELLLYGIASIHDKYTQEPQVGGGSLVKFNYHKTKFADEIIEQLHKDDFINFQPLFDVIKKIVRKF